MKLDETTLVFLLSGLCSNCLHDPACHVAGKCPHLESEEEMFHVCKGERRAAA